MQKLKVIAFITVFLITVANLTFFIKSHLAIYTYPVNPAFLEKLYGQSQYVRTDPISILPDETIYAYAAWRYMHGANPAIFNADQPPLGKYLIGLSEIYFNNERLTGPVFNILSLAALFILSLLIFKDYLWSIILVALFSFEKLFIAQMLYAPLLDNIQLFFILLSFIFYILSKDKVIYLIPAFISLGLVMSTKFWITGAVLFLVWLLHTITIKNRKKIVTLFLYSPTILVTMLIVYIPAFLQGNSLRSFFGVQRYIYEFHKGKLNFDPTAVWDLLLFNRWHVPWEGVVKTAADWQWTWPVMTILTVLAIIRIGKSNLKEKCLNGPLGVVLIWIVVYFVLLSVSTVLPRYLFPVMPLMYIFSFWVLKDFFTERIKFFSN
ncbi:hypothetical protein C4577_00965 [Candidatus Parcubacteria bacterium]|nr:MAG: hypothetical protein C4577_00965 [Candidatus Parcubacteria bacterium]